MMNLFEDPTQFAINKKVGEIQIMYFDLMEIAQGGPLSGYISINGKTMEGRFGGPFLIKDNYIYIPILEKKFFGIGFKLARINTFTLEIKRLSKIKDLIFLEKIEENKIYFFEDISKTIERTISI